MPRKPKGNSFERKYGLKQNEVVRVITETHGLLELAAQRLGVTRGVLQDYIRRVSICAMAYKEARESMGDIAERKLFEQIEQGDVRCIMYYLSTVHRGRGYGVSKNSDPAQFAQTSNQIYVTEINVVSVPSDTYLTPEEAAAPVIEEIANEAPAVNGKTTIKLLS